MKRILFTLIALAGLAVLGQDKSTPTTPTPTAPAPKVSDNSRADYMAAYAGNLIAQANYESMFRRWDQEMKQRIQDLQSSQQALESARLSADRDCSASPGWVLSEPDRQQGVLHCIAAPTTTPSTAPNPTPTTAK